METKVLPQEIMIEVLSRLPVKSILRFRGICKFVYVLIGDPSFIYKHLKNENNTRLIVHSQKSIGSFKCSLFLDETLVDLSRQSLNHQSHHCAGIITGPFSGIFCIFMDEHQTLWNPATKEFKKLPKYRHPNRRYVTAFEKFIGFGYDSMSNYYKLVLVFGFLNNKTVEREPYVHVALYNLNTNSWRDLKCWQNEFNALHRMDEVTHTYLDGTCYWLLTSCNMLQENVEYGRSRILAFHMGNEVFDEIKGPNIPESTIVRTIGLYSEFLSIITFNDVEHYIEMWVRKERNWYKQLFVKPFYNIPIGFWKKDAILILRSDEYRDYLVLYEPTNGEMRNLGFKCLIPYFTHKYTESLITIKDYDSSVDFFDIPWHIMGFD